MNQPLLLVYFFDPETYVTVFQSAQLHPAPYVLLSDPQVTQQILDLINRGPISWSL